MEAAAVIEDARPDFFVSFSLSDCRLGINYEETNLDISHYIIHDSFFHDRVYIADTLLSILD